jgi:glycerol-3-phosphate dehydrogenase (NAD(P)+)
LSELAIIGAGSWGTALSIVLAPRFRRVRLWAYDPGLADKIRTTRENAPYLPGFRVGENVLPTDDLAEALDDVPIALIVIPTQFLRKVFQRMVPLLHAQVALVSAAKGIENGSLLRMSQVLQEVAAPRFAARVAVLSGPTFAREIASGQPAAVAISSADSELATTIQKAFSGPSFRLYTNSDPAGVEIGAALKNVIAIGAGICHGLGLGNNTLAALITRGLAEISRLAVEAGGQPQTLAGLAGLGDLVLTCTGELSRNRRVGLELAHGRNLPEILTSTNMVPEGVETTYAAVELARALQVEMPITAQMYEVLKLGKEPRNAIRHLMDRTLKAE